MFPRLVLWSFSPFFLFSDCYHFQIRYLKGKDALKWRQILSATSIKRLFLLPGRMAIKTLEKLLIPLSSGALDWSSHFSKANRLGFQQIYQSFLSHPIPSPAIYKHLTRNVVYRLHIMRCQTLIRHVNLFFFFKANTLLF